MKGTIVKLPARYVLIMGEGESQQIEFGRSGYQLSEVARHYGVDDIKVVDHKCLKLTLTSD